MVTALTDPDELVLDPYAGSGTTLVSAARLGRRFVGLDASTLSLETVSRRMADDGRALVPEPAESERVLTEKSPRKKTA